MNSIEKIIASFKETDNNIITSNNFFCIEEEKLKIDTKRLIYFLQHGYFELSDTKQDLYKKIVNKDFVKNIYLYELTYLNIPTHVNYDLDILITYDDLLKATRLWIKKIKDEPMSDFTYYFINYISNICKVLSKNYKDDKETYNKCIKLIVDFYYFENNYFRSDDNDIFFSSIDIDFVKLYNDYYVENLLNHLNYHNHHYYNLILMSQFKLNENHIKIYYDKISSYINNEHINDLIPIYNYNKSNTDLFFKYYISLDKDNWKNIYLDKTSQNFFTNILKDYLVEEDIIKNFDIIYNNKNLLKSLFDNKILDDKLFIKIIDYNPFHIFCFKKIKITIKQINTIFSKYFIENELDNISFINLKKFYNKYINLFSKEQIKFLYEYILERLEKVEIEKNNAINSQKTVKSSIINSMNKFAPNSFYGGISGNMSSDEHYSSVDKLINKLSVNQQFILLSKLPSYYKFSYIKKPKISLIIKLCNYDINKYINDLYIYELTKNQTKSIIKN
jgi:hypothetical protein